MNEHDYLAEAKAIHETLPPGYWQRGVMAALIAIAERVDIGPIDHV